MKILFLSHQYPPESGFGGIGSYISTMSQALSRRGHEVHVLCCWQNQDVVDRRDGDVYVHRRRNLRVHGLHKVMTMPGGREIARALTLPEDQQGASPGKRLATALTCYREYQKLGIDVDVVESPDWMAEGLVFALRRDVPLVTDFKGNLLTYSAGAGDELDWHGRLANRMERLTVRRSAVVTSPSELTKGYLDRAGWARAATATLIRRPVDLQRWQPATADDTRPSILQVGRLEALKAPHVLLRAAGILTKTVPELEVVFAGGTKGMIDGQPAGPLLEQLAADLGVRCRFAGYQAWTQMQPWYHQARVIALASRFDNFPNVGLEAMASGRPVVCSSVTGLAELADEAGDALTVVPPDDAGALAAALEPYLLDPQHATRAGQQGRRCVERLCSPDLIAAQREAVYVEAIGFGS